MSVDLDLGTLIEGVVELDPMTGRMVLRIQQSDGSNSFVDVQETLGKYQGQAVRFIMSPLAAIAELARMVESGDLPVENVPKLPLPGDKH